MGSETSQVRQNAAEAVSMYGVSTGVDSSFHFAAVFVKRAWALP